MNKITTLLIAGASLVFLSGCTVDTTTTRPGYSSTYVYSTGYRYPYSNTRYYGVGLGTGYYGYGNRYYGSRYYYGNRYYGHRYYGGYGRVRNIGYGRGRIGRWR